MILWVLVVLVCTGPVGEGSAQPTAPALAASARSEGRVVVYSALSSPFMDGLVSDFQKAYPGVHADYLRLPSAEILAKLTAEQATHHYTADVYLAWWDTVSQVVRSGLSAKFVPSQAAALPPFLRDAAGYWYGVGEITYLMGYNNRLLQPSQAPQDWLALTDPKWSDKIGVIDPRIRGGAYIFYYHMWKVFGDGFLASLGKNKPFIQQQHAALVSAVASGQIAIAAGGDTDWMEGIQKGAPITLVRPARGVPMMDLIVTPLKQASHPNAARLFVEWLVSEEGQTAIVHNPKPIYASRPGMPAPAGLPALGTMKRIPTDYLEFLRVADAVTDRAASALGLPTR